MSDDKLRQIRDLLDRPSSDAHAISTHCADCGGEQAIDPFDASRCVFGHPRAEVR